ncbi:MAG: hypothetical protein ACHP78_04730, partial [Terriglobales bacterium]
VVASAVVFTFRKRAKHPIVDGIPAEVYVVHVERSVTKRRTVGVAAMRDGAYFTTDERLGFLGTWSACKQRKGVLPPQWSLARLRAVVDMPEFKKISPPTRGSAALTWYVRARVGQDYKCFALTEDEAAHSSAMQPLLLWVSDLSKNKPNEISTNKCSASTAESLPTFCQTFP